MGVAGNAARAAVAFDGDGHRSFNNDVREPTGWANPHAKARTTKLHAGALTYVPADRRHGPLSVPISPRAARIAADAAAAEQAGSDAYYRRPAPGGWTAAAAAAAAADAAAAAAATAGVGHEALRRDANRAGDRYGRESAATSATMDPAASVDGELPTPRATPWAFSSEDERQSGLPGVADHYTTRDHTHVHAHSRLRLELATESAAAIEVSHQDYYLPRPPTTASTHRAHHTHHTHHTHCTHRTHRTYYTHRVPTMSIWPSQPPCHPPTHTVQARSSSVSSGQTWRCGASPTPAQALEASHAPRLPISARRTSPTIATQVTKVTKVTRRAPCTHLPRRSRARRRYELRLPSPSLYRHCVPPIPTCRSPPVARHPSRPTRRVIASHRHVRR